MNLDLDKGQVHTVRTLPKTQRIMWFSQTSRVPKGLVWNEQEKTYYWGQVPLYFERWIYLNDKNECNGYTWATISDTEYEVIESVETVFFNWADDPEPKEVPKNGIVLAKEHFLLVHDYIEQNRYTPKGYWVVTGVDMFDYTDYPVALCDTREQVDEVIKMRKETRQPGSLGDATWVQAPFSLERTREI